MPDTEPQSTQSEKITPLTKELPTLAPKSAPSEQPSVFETTPAEPAPAPVESPPTTATPTSIEPPSAPTEPVAEQLSAPAEPQSAPSVTDNQQLTTNNQMPTTQTPQSPPSEQAQPSPHSLLQRAREKIQFRKKAKLEKIMALAQKKQSITNDDVEKLLRVSDATATRYLAELVRQERLKRSGIRGSAKYEPV